MWRGVCCGEDEDGNVDMSTDEVAYWSVTGQKLATYQLSGYGLVEEADDPPPLTATQTATWYYFGSKMIKNANLQGYVAEDRLGSIGHFYPYGQEKPSATPERDGEVYRVLSEMGRRGWITLATVTTFQERGDSLTPDPYKSNGGGVGDPTNPVSWNKYAYALGDPVRYRDPHGLFSCDGDYEDGEEDFTSSDCGLTKAI